MNTNRYDRIDTHCHLFTDAYRTHLASHGITHPDGVPMPEWDVGRQLDAMDGNGITHSILSISSPPINFGDNAEAGRVARVVNEETAAIVSEHRSRLSFMASLPVPDVDGAIIEAEHALDSLEAVGITLPTNALGIYLGNPTLDPLMAVLDARQAIVSIHPTEPSAVPAGVNEGLPTPTLEFFFDTSRTVINMMLKNLFGRYPAIRWIIPHAGAVIPILADRLHYYAASSVDVCKCWGEAVC